MKTKTTLILLMLLPILQQARAQSQANCNNLYLDTATFYISTTQDTIVSGTLHYNDTTLTVYPFLHLILHDTTLITSPDIEVLSAVDSGSTNNFKFNIKFKSKVFQNNAVVNGLFHIYDSDWPGDSIVTCYYPITIVLRQPTGIYENQVEKPVVTTFPNPAKNFLTIEFNLQESKNYMLKIYNIHGQPVQTITELNAKTIELERTTVPAGIYLLQLSADGVLLSTAKIILE